MARLRGDLRTVQKPLLAKTLLCKKKMHLMNHQRAINLVQTLFHIIFKKEKKKRKEKTIFLFSKI